MQVSKILLLCDLIESYSMELKIEANHEFKKRVNDVVKYSRRMVKIADNHLGQSSDIFGNDADKLKQEIDEMFVKL